MSRIFPIASGSSGNCTFIGHKNDGILIDVGISCKAVTDALNQAAFDPKALKGIFITHEHIDHISGLRVFAKKHNVPVFASEKTACAILCQTPELEDCLHVLEHKLDLGDMEIERFATSHDCEGSSGYAISLSNGRKCAVCTDLGVISAEVHSALSGCKTVLLESNHDVTMLQNGPYPPYLKNRILSEKGHLSNIACASELAKLVDTGTERIILGHLSRENNRPEIARGCTTASLMDKKMIEDSDYTLYIAPPKNGKAIIF